MKLRQEKADLVHEISEIKQEAHQGIIKVEASLKSRIRALETVNSTLKQQLEGLQENHASLQAQHDDAQATIEQHVASVHQVLS